MNVAIGRMQVSVRVVEQTRPRSHEPKQTTPTSTAQRAFESERLRHEVEADRRRWTSSTLLSGPQRR